MRCKRDLGQIREPKALDAAVSALSRQQACALQGHTSGTGRTEDGGDASDVKGVDAGGVSMIPSVPFSMSTSNAEVERLLHLTGQTSSRPSILVNPMITKGIILQNLL
jgi:hypothetical protein